jgi:UDP-sugar pyrophosphorylase
VKVMRGWRACGRHVQAHKAHGIITPAQAALGSALVAAGQAHLFANWPNTGSDDAHKQRLMAQVESIDGNYAGGLMAYIANAKELLEASRAGLNPLEGWTPAVPQGKTLAYGDAEFTACEARGMQEVGAAAFVLVAGGLGERLGFSGIKVALPVESTTNECFLGMYCRSILALQAAAAAAGSSRKLPLAIMTSGDTHQRTEALLKANEYFGMSPDQVTLMKQEKVPCLADNNAALALAANDAYTIQTKPHGHGDVHMLLHSTGLLKQWKAQGVSWVCFFQDTNALVFRAITAALGVSAAENFEVNSLAVPRKAKEAIGGIARLDNAAGDSMTLNVEYNQLDPLLRATINAEGDVNDPATGHSPFPGNINQLVLALEPYEAQLQVTGGAIAEFVNPKYKNAERTEFKAPTRLECMMQDYPKSLGKQARVGFTTLEVWAAYSPVKNSPDEGRGKAKGGSPSHTATSGELDVYMANCRLLEMAGAKVEAPKRVQYNGLELMQPASVVLSPAFAVSLAAVKAKVTCKSRMGVKVSQRSTLVLDGEDIELRGLQLDGALLVTAVPGAKVIIDGLKVHNDGCEPHALHPVCGASMLPSVAPARR